MSRISVVTAVYNGAPNLAATLESILGQTEADIELIVVNDGSTDSTAEILASYAESDRRIRRIDQENLGLTRALAAGCAAARAPFIARHDVADLSHARRFEVQLRMLEDDQGVAFVSCATQYVGPEGEPLWIASPTGAALEAADILDTGLPGALLDGPTHHGSVMFRRDAYERAGGYRAQFYYGQDFDLWFRFAELGKFQTTNDVLYTARVTPASISGVARGEQERLARLSRAALRARLLGQPEDEILAEASSIGRVQGTASLGPGLYFIGEALRRNDDPRARKYLRRAIAAQPLSLRAWIRWVQSLR